MTRATKSNGNKCNTLLSGNLSLKLLASIMPYDLSNSPLNSDGQRLSKRKKGDIHISRSLDDLTHSTGPFASVLY